LQKSWKADIKKRMASWDFGSETGVFKVAADFPGNVLYVTTIGGIASMKLGAVLDINEEKLQLLVRSIESRYIDVPYHSSVHAADVVHGAFWIMEHGGLGQMLEPLHKLVLMISACAHDMNHPGTSNAFQVSTKSEVALRYNDISVLENM
jgi:3',5'-cyclic-nucleotide phosphodiesterase